MAAVSFSQNWASDSSVHDGLDVLEVDSALLMSFLEETQGEECDHDQLLTVMKSLEAEIDCDSSHGIIKLDRQQTGLLIDDHDHHQQADHHEYYGWMGGRDCSSTSSESFDFKWMDMDMDLQDMDMNMDLQAMNMDTGNWYMNHFGCGNNNIDELIEYEGTVAGDVYSAIYSAGVQVGMEEQSYGSLWQES